MLVWTADDGSPANDACYHAGPHSKDDLYYEDDLCHEDDLCYEDDTYCADDLYYEDDPYCADDGYYEDDLHCTNDMCHEKHPCTEGVDYFGGDLHDTDPISGLLAEMIKPPAADIKQATPAEGLDSDELSLITKVILRFSIPLGEPSLPLLYCTC